MFTEKENPKAVTLGHQNNTNRNINYTAPLQYIKSGYEHLSRKFWVANYSLEESRQDHAARGHLWRQIGYCIVLLAFRLAGKVVR